MQKFLGVLDLGFSDEHPDLEGIYLAVWVFPDGTVRAPIRASVMRTLTVIP